MEKDDIKDDIIEAESYRAREVFSFRELFLIQIRRCMNIGSREMREGFWIYSQSPNQSAQKIRYVGDAREEYVNSVTSLVDLTQTRFDDDAKDKISEILEKYKEEHEEAKEKHKKEEQGEREDIVKDWNKRRVEIYREIFREVCNFGERKKWFETKPTTE